MASPTSNLSIDPVSGAVTYRKRDAPTPEEVAAALAAEKQRRLVAFPYFRASDDSSQMLGSVRSQEQTFIDWCKKTNVDPLLDEDGNMVYFRDNDLSGWKLSVVRDEFERMIGMSLLGELKADILWCLMSSRLSRNSRDTDRVMSLTNPVEAGGCGYQIVDYTKPELDTRTDMGKLFLRWVLKEAENDSAAKSVVISRAIVADKTEGEPPGWSDCPWGFTRLVDEAGRPLKVPGKSGPRFKGYAMDWEAHQHIRLATSSLLKHGHSYYRVGEQLADLGVSRVVHQTQTMNMERGETIDLGTPRWDLPRERMKFQPDTIHKRFRSAFMAGYREYPSEHDENGKAIQFGLTAVKWASDLVMDWTNYEACAADGCAACTETLQQRDRGESGGPVLPRHLSLAELAELRDKFDEGRELAAGKNQNRGGRRPQNDCSGVVECPNCKRGLIYWCNNSKKGKSPIYGCHACASRRLRVLHGCPDGKTATIRADWADMVVGDAVEAAVKDGHLHEIISNAVEGDDRLNDLLREKLELEQQITETKKNTRLSAADRGDIVSNLREEVNKKQTIVNVLLSRRGSFPILPDDFVREFRAYWSGEKRLPDGDFADVAWRQRVIRLIFKRIVLLPAEGPSSIKRPETITRRFKFEFNS